MTKALVFLVFNVCLGVVLSAAPPGFRCTCYTDIDECSSPYTNNCGSGARCVNTEGSFRCESCDNGDCNAKPGQRTCIIPSGSSNNLLARGKTVTMSSQYQDSAGYSFEGAKAVDGIYLPTGMHEYSSIAIAKRNSTEWMQIDLGEQHCVSAVKIWYRGVHVAAFQNILITVGDTKTEVANADLNGNLAMCTYFDGHPGSRIYQFNCDTPKRGRYVRVTRRQHEGYFNVYEIEVIGN